MVRNLFILARIGEAGLAKVNVLTFFLPITPLQGLSHLIFHLGPYKESEDEGTIF